MNKSVLVAGVVLLLLSLGLGAFVLSKRTSKPTTPTSQTSQLGNTQPTQSVSPKKSLKDLMGLGLTQECKFEDATTGSEGIVHTSGNKVHGKFSSEVEGQTVKSNMLSDGKTIYIWSEGQNQGMKIDVSSMEDLSDAPEAQKGSANLDQQFDYRCTTWVVDSSVFDLPKGVIFQDLSSLMQPSVTSAQGGDGNAESGECSACDNLPAAAKQQCLQTLGC